MRLHKLIGTIAMAALVGCSSDNNNSTPDAPPPAPDAKVTPDAAPAGFTQPSGTVAVNFTVDDTANKVYTATQTDGATDLQWKGSMIWDPVTRKVTLDTTWGGPWAPLYDDGPWTTGGHEPVGSTAGDHKLGITVFATPPATAMDGYEYGLNDNAYQTAYGNGWSWIGSNGTFSVAAGATAAVTAQGQTFAPFGTTDLQLTIDLTMLDSSTAWDTSVVGIKGSAWDWGVVTLTKTATTAVFTLSGVTGSGHPFNHSGLLSTGDKPEWNFVFGSGASPLEYKDANGNALKAGITAAVKAHGAGSFTPVTIQLYDKADSGNGNTYITTP